MAPAGWFGLAQSNNTERYSAQDTIAAQRNVHLRTGSVLYSNEGNPMARVVTQAARASAAWR
jgi:uncharacterized protein YcgI (DUF1989 family)